MNRVLALPVAMVSARSSFSLMATALHLKPHTRHRRTQIIAGAAILFTYMLMCAFHRKLLAPSKA